MSKDVFVYIEQRDNKLEKVGIELLGKARELADQLNENVVAILLGEKIKGLAETLIGHGADKVIYVESPLLKEYVTEPYAKAVFEIIEKYEPNIVLYGATSIGRDLAPRLAARIHTGLTADCTKLEIDPDSNLLLMTRPAFGGNLMATIVCEEYKPQMATVRPGVMQALAFDETRQGEVFEENISFSEEDMNLKIVKIEKKVSDRKDITEADILVSAGRGIGNPENLVYLEDLARELNAEVSSSRAVVDAGWQTHDRQVGQTGKTVRPNLYFALGISGAIQHQAGMEDSDLIFAINTDEDAPIFQLADYGVVGDLNEIIPRLTELIRKEKALRASLNK